MNMMPATIQRPKSRPTLRRGRRGFTLVELMIVISILLFLITLAALAFGGMFTRAQATRTIQAINVTMDVLERFRLQFPVRHIDEGLVERGYPVKANWNNFDMGDPQLEISTMTDGEWLRILLAPTPRELERLETVGITSSAAALTQDGTNVLSRFVNERDIRIQIGNDSREIREGMAITDGWQRPLYYRFPGNSHVAQRNYRRISGTNNFMLGIPDIWSAGRDGISFYGPYGGEQPLSDTVGSWADSINNPFRSGEEPEYVDDITNWFPTDSY